MSDEVRAFCDEAVRLDDALLVNDLDSIEASLLELSDTALSEDAQAIVDELANTVQGAPFDPTYMEAHTALIDYVRANCEYATVDVSAQEYMFEGIPSEVAAESTRFVVENIGGETHFLYIARIEDPDLPIEEILELPEDERDELLTGVAWTFVVPTETKATRDVDLRSGRHVAVCFLDEGTSSAEPAEVLESIGPFSDDPPPHWDVGMFTEFWVP